MMFRVFVARHADRSGARRRIDTVVRIGTRMHVNRSRARLQVRSSKNFAGGVNIARTCPGGQLAVQPADADGTRSSHCLHFGLCLFFKLDIAGARMEIGGSRDPKGANRPRPGLGLQESADAVDAKVARPAGADSGLWSAVPRSRSRS